MTCRRGESLIRSRTHRDHARSSSQWRESKQNLRLKRPCQSAVEPIAESHHMKFPAGGGVGFADDEEAAGRQGPRDVREQAILRLAR